MKDDLEQLLRSLHLRKIAEIFDEEAKRAEKADQSYQEFVARLLRAQWQANQEAALAWRIKRAGIPEQWTLETFPFKRQPGVNARRYPVLAIRLRNSTRDTARPRARGRRVARRGAHGSRSLSPTSAH